MGNEKLRPVNDQVPSDKEKVDAGGDMSRREFLTWATIGGGTAMASLLFGCGQTRETTVLGEEMSSQKNEILEVAEVEAPQATVTPTSAEPFDDEPYVFATEEPSPGATATQIEEEELTTTPEPTQTATHRPRATRTPAPAQNEAVGLMGNEYFYGNTGRRVVIMTYDDAATYEQVSTILAAYNSYGMKATFFIVGDRLTGMASSINEMINGGHQVGCHGWSHGHMDEMDKGTIEKEFDDFMTTWRQIAPGYQVKYFRAPYGARNNLVRSVAATYGMDHIMWSMYSDGSVEQTYNNVVDHVGNGAIVLCHMMRYYDVHQAKDIVGFLVGQGYSLETVESGLR